jgi:hypothetical protein
MTLRNAPREWDGMAGNLEVIWVRRQALFPKNRNIFEADTGWLRRGAAVHALSIAHGLIIFARKTLPRPPRPARRP